MQQEVYGEVVQGEIVGVVQPAPVIPTATPVTTQPGFSSEVELGAYKGFGQGFNQVAPSAPPRVIDSGLVLVRAGSPGVLRFDQFQALQAGMAAPLTCHASNPGNGVGTKYPEERTFGEWRYTESKMVAAQNACMAQLVQGKFIKRVDANLVLDVAFWVFQEGTAVNWVGGGSDSRTYLNGGGRDFRVNPDGSICLVNHPHLYLGVFDPETVDRYSGPRSDGLLSTDEISGNYCCCCFPLGFGATTVMPHGPDVIEQWGWFWSVWKSTSASVQALRRTRRKILIFTQVLVHDALPRRRSARTKSGHEQLSALERSQQRDDVYARRGLERALVPLQDGVEGTAGLPTRGHEGHRRVVVLLLLDAHDRLVLLHEESFGQRQTQPLGLRVDITPALAAVQRSAHAPLRQRPPHERLLRARPQQHRLVPRRRLRRERPVVLDKVLKRTTPCRRRGLYVIPT